MGFMLIYDEAASTRKYFNRTLCTIFLQFYSFRLHVFRVSVTPANNTEHKVHAQCSG